VKNEQQVRSRLTLTLYTPVLTYAPLTLPVNILHCAHSVHLDFFMNPSMKGDWFSKKKYSVAICHEGAFCRCVRIWLLSTFIWILWSRKFQLF